MGDHSLQTTEVSGNLWVKALKAQLHKVEAATCLTLTYLTRSMLPSSGEKPFKAQLESPKIQTPHPHHTFLSTVIPF